MRSSYSTAAQTAERAERENAKERKAAERRAADGCRACDLDLRLCVKHRRPLP